METLTTALEKRAHKDGKKDGVQAMQEAVLEVALRMGLSSDMAQKMVAQAREEVAMDWVPTNTIDGGKTK